MEPKKYRRLSLKERTIIETLLKENRKTAYIAKQLNRSRSTICRELNTWIKKPQDKYDADLAYWCALSQNSSKREPDKINQFPRLKIAVYRGLLLGDSPELISGRLKLEHPHTQSLQVSYEPIYKHIYTHPQGKINMKLIKLLVRHKARRIRKVRREDNICIKDRTSIDNRPEYIIQRLEAGHWEGDLMIGLRQASCIGTIVERKTRYVILVKLANKKSETVTNAFAEKLNVFDFTLRLTMTYDNGTEMAYHKSLTDQTGMDIYFAHPYSSWERGTNENTNGLVSRYYPKKTDFSTVTEEQLEQLQNRLNNRPRKVLGYYTANEMLQAEINKTLKPMLLLRC
jgi:IS30 family transposase